ncbi:MAG: hypothetical protein COZ18_10410 [Flexibacter sp. CG_4_10_14_3_um_filter_32_15]|nr:MAG: hypothetical protein COZ18_10410 [Flexibacter sp. CG_4_10_14_3_um_filter_32_15]
MKNTFFILTSFVLLFFTACTSSNVEKENTEAFVVKKEGANTEELPKKEESKIMKYSDLEESLQGGIVNVTIEDEDFADKDYIFETLRTKNVIEYNQNTKEVTIKVANYQNTNTNLVIKAIGDKKGRFSVGTNAPRSATIIVYYNNGLINLKRSLETGILNIDIFDEEKGYARGRIEGKTEKGSPIEATFSVYSNQ